MVVENVKQENIDQIIKDATDDAVKLADGFKSRGYDYMTLAYKVSNNNTNNKKLVFATIPFKDENKDNLYYYLYQNGMTEVFTLDLKEKE